MNEAPDLPVPAAMSEVELDRALEAHSTGQPVPWRPRSIGEAEWCALRLAAAKAQIAAVHREIDEMVAHVQAWADKRSTDPDMQRALRSAAFFTSHLEQYALMVRETSVRDSKGEPSIKSVSLPSASIATRKSPDSLVIDDPDVFAAWMRANAKDLTGESVTIKPEKLEEAANVLIEIGRGDLVAREFKFARSAFRAWAQAAGDRLRTPDGEEIPGCSLRIGEVKAHVEVDAPAIGTGR